MATTTRRVLKGTEREETAARAAGLYLQGCTIQSVADQIGRSYGSTRELLLEAKVRLRPRGGMTGRYGSAARR
jgi:hypothetical protein